MRFTNKHILLGITGGIAAYKSAELVRLLRKAGAQVKIVMTDSAKQFITPLTLEALSGHPVYDDLFQSRTEPATQHISLARWADVVIIAPATANSIAKLAHGLADDLLSTLCLSTKAKIIIAPAMNQVMWHHAATQENVLILKTRQEIIIEPTEGEQACGEVGVGRMAELSTIMDVLDAYFQPPILLGKKILITAGPTYEAIDPVRFIGNHSSGKMGFALAEAAVNAGAQVSMICGPVHLTTPRDVARKDVVSATEMFDAVMSQIKEQDIFISVAAVADYGCTDPKMKKIKRSDEALTLTLSKNPDILSSVAALPNPPFIVGFAAESENLIENAQAKLRNKRADIIVANLINQKDSGFNSDFNRVIFVTKQGAVESGLKSKHDLAREIVRLIGIPA